MKNPMTQAGIEPATFRFVAQHLNHCATAVPFLTEGFCHIPQHLHARAGTVPGKGNDFFLPNPFWVVIHSLPVT